MFAAENYFATSAMELSYSLQKEHSNVVYTPVQSIEEQP
jgi:hypothetical protein